MQKQRTRSQNSVQDLVLRNPLTMQLACYVSLAGAIVFSDRYPIRARERAARHAEQQARAQAAAAG